ncbi:MAG: DUF3945 domain-containing protein [Prevotellaceae bacterium]|jgi:hypothetical protein|nr:DUF3945 domain-containing protein [Prevotellaceae bacterium]
MKSNGKQVLLVSDAADPKALKAVTGLDKHGKLKTVNPNCADVADFFAIDKNGNVLENFFKKFIEQAKNPLHTGFLLISKDLLDKIIKIQPIDGKMPESYRVGPQKYLFAVQEQSEKVQEQGEAPAQKAIFRPINESKINWRQGGSMGVSKEMLEKLNLPQSLKGVDFTSEQLKNMKEGKMALVEGMTSKKNMETDNPKKFDAYILRYNAVKGCFDFSYGGQDKNRHQQDNRQRQSGDGQGVRIPQKLLGVELTQKRQDDPLANKGMVKNGPDQPFNAYITVNHEAGKLNLYKFNPDKAQKQGAEVKPAIENKTQAVVNTEDKTDEATKRVKEPLKQG